MHFLWTNLQTNVGKISSNNNGKGVYGGKVEVQRKHLSIRKPNIGRRVRDKLWFENIIKSLVIKMSVKEIYSNKVQRCVNVEYECRVMTKRGHCWMERFFHRKTIFYLDVIFIRTIWFLFYSRQFMFRCVRGAWAREEERERGKRTR